MIDGQAIGWITCFGQLVLVGLALRAAERPLGRLLAALSCSLLVWNFAALMSDKTGLASWHQLDLSTSPTTPPLALHLVLVLVGEARRRYLVLALAYGSFGGLSLMSLLGFASPSVAAWMSGGTWTVIYVLLGCPLFAGIIASLVRYHADSVHREERLRVRLVLAAFTLGGGLMLTELLNDYWPSLPGLGSLGALTFALLLTTVVSRYGITGREPLWPGLWYAVPLACLGVGLLMTLQRVLPGKGGVPAVATLLLAVTVVLLVATREFAFEVSKRRERERRLLYLGRLSAQLSHDLRNPLATIKGALEYLREGADANECQRFFTLMHAQVERMQGVLEGYGRLGRLELEPQRMCINELLAQTVEASTLANSHVKLEFCPALNLPACSVDAKLLWLAIENLIRNAAQACRLGGHITVRTAAGASDGVVLIQVEDDGEGVLPADQEYVFDEFFTTRDLGTGLGLHFVRRVAHAHGGEVLLESRAGVGTIVSLCLPSQSAA
jgi:two-component system sensor histidine kinase HydH